MKQILGKSIAGKRVVSKTGSELGNVYDIDFELDGKINFFLVKPEKVIGEIAEYVESNGLISIPYEAIIAVGSYVVADFPQTAKKK